MTPEEWLALTAVLVIGAMSPGPSLVLVLRNTLRGGRRQGVLTALGHGIGFGCYAFLVAIGIATALSTHPITAHVVRWGGAILLISLGVHFLRSGLSRASEGKASVGEGTTEKFAFAQGFFVALLNPKILAWLLALYTPFIKADMPATTLLKISMLGMCADGTWDLLVALLLSRSPLLERLRTKGHTLDIAMGVLMLLFAGILLAKLP
jgi:threonine/homoserine/homoserine lactone efflux protein